VQSSSKAVVGCLFHVSSGLVQQLDVVVVVVVVVVGAGFHQGI
jgi:hypothetical protein